MLQHDFYGIKEDEGSVVKNGRHMVYKDSKGILTLGYGRNIEERGISEAEAELMLRNDIEQAMRDAARFTDLEQLSEARRGVIINMAFNLGLTRLNGFKKLKAALIAKDYQEAALQMLDSKWASDVGRRANRLAETMRKG